MSDHDDPSARARGVRYSRELEGHLPWLDTFSGTALSVLAVASGIYTYLGVSSLLAYYTTLVITGGISNHGDTAVFGSDLSSLRI